MAWTSEIYSRRGNRCGYGELPGSILTPTDAGWDTAVMNIATRDAVGSYFQKGDPHPDYAGMYVSSDPEEGEMWRGNIRRFTVRFAGMVGYSGGLVTRQEIYGGQRTERTVTANDYYGDETPVPGYGGGQRRIINVPGGVADAIRLVALQPYLERQFVTSQAPPSMYSLESLKVGSSFISPSAPTSLSDLGVELIYTYPNGMLASSVRYTKHPAQTVNLWLLDIRWEAVAAREVA
jgi:hypothetical protein